MVVTRANTYLITALHEIYTKQSACFIALKYTVTNSQESLRHSQESLLHSQESLLHSQESLRHSQESLRHSQENLQHLQVSLSFISIRPDNMSSYKKYNAEKLF